jgi:hypothetical protein
MDVSVEEGQRNLCKRSSVGHDAVDDERSPQALRPRGSASSLRTIVNKFPLDMADIWQMMHFPSIIFLIVLKWQQIIIHF